MSVVEINRVEPLGGPARTARLRRTGSVARYAVSRLLSAVFVLWAVATVTFFVQQLMPGNQAVTILQLTTGNVSVDYPADQLAAVNEQYGLNEPVLTRYGDYLAQLAHGDLGHSYQLKSSVWTIIGEQAGPTVALTVTALVLAWLVTLALTVTTSGRGRKVSAATSGFEVFTAALPQYWLGVILLVVFGVNLGWFPVTGGTGISGLVLPALTLAIPLAGFLGQVTRDEFERTLDQPFVTTARARGMGDVAVRFKHALRHSVLPAITLTGWALGGLISAAVIVELVFARQGLGQVLVTAAVAQDTPLVAGIVMFVALVYVVANLLVDLAYRIVDPRIGTQA